MNIKIIDDFLLKEDFEKLCKLELKRLKNNEIHVYHNEISGNKIIKNDLIEKDFLFHLNKKYTDRGLEILRELCPEKLNLYEYSDFTLIHTGSNYKFPIHDDTPNKLLSGVIYLKPEVNKGTFFYKDKEGNEKKEIEWKQNRAVFFARKEKKSWHSYEGDKNSPRIALVFNLMTTDISSVAKYEQTNFLSTYVRFKINPYLYRFFNFTI